MNLITPQKKPFIQPKIYNKTNYALSFDGVDDQVRVNNSSELQLTDNFKIKFRFKPFNLTQNDIYIIQKSNRYAIILEYADNTVEFFSSNYTGDDPRAGSQITIPDTNWHKIEYIYDGTTFTGKLDNIEVFSLSKTFTLNINTDDLILGSTSSANYFNGFLDDIEIYKNRTLSAHYKINEGAGTTLTDSAGTNDGTINGATWQEVDY